MHIIFKSKLLNTICCTCNKYLNAIINFILLCILESNNYNVGNSKLLDKQVIIRFIKNINKFKLNFSLALSSTSLSYNNIFISVNIIVVCNFAAIDENLYYFLYFKIVYGCGQNQNYTSM